MSKVKVYYCRTVRARQSTRQIPPPWWGRLGGDERFFINAPPQPSPQVGGSKIGRCPLFWIVSFWKKTLYAPLQTLIICYLYCIRTYNSEITNLSKCVISYQKTVDSSEAILALLKKEPFSYFKQNMVLLFLDEKWAKMQIFLEKSFFQSPKSLISNAFYL